LEKENLIKMKYKRATPRIQDGYECVCSECETTFLASRPTEKCPECRMVVHQDGTPYYITEVEGKTFFFNVRIFTMLKNKPRRYIISSPYNVTSVIRNTSPKWLLSELNNKKPKITMEEMKGLFGDALKTGKFDKNTRSNVVTVSLVCDSHLKAQDKNQNSKWQVCTLAQITQFTENQLQLARQANYEAHKRAEQHFLESG